MMGLLLLLGAPAWAHGALVEGLQVRLSEDTATISMTVGVSVLPFVDEDGDGRVDAGELERQRAAVLEAAAMGLQLRGDGALAHRSFQDVFLPPAGDGRALQLMLRDEWPHAPEEVRIRTRLFDGPQDSVRLTVVDGGARRRRSGRLTPEQPGARLRGGAPTAARRPRGFMAFALLLGGLVVSRLR